MAAAVVVVRGQGRVRPTHPAADHPSEPGRVPDLDLDLHRARNLCRPLLLHSVVLVVVLVDLSPNISAITTTTTPPVISDTANMFLRRQPMPVAVLRIVQWRCKRRPRWRGWLFRRSSRWDASWVDRMQVQVQRVRMALHLAMGVLLLQLQQLKTPPRWRGRSRPSRRHLRRHPSPALRRARNTSAGATGVSSPNRSRRTPRRSGARDGRPSASHARRSIGGLPRR